MIDVHTHCLQHTHWGPEWDTNWKPVYQREWVDVTPTDFDAAMTDGGVDLAFVFGMRATKQGVRTPNKFVAQFCQDTTTPTVGFASLDLSDPDVMDQLDEGVSLGLRGVKLYPVLAGFDPRSPEHDRFYAEATRLGLVVLWHMGATPSPAGDLALSNPLLVDNVASRHPDLVQIIAHLGHPWQRESIVTCRKNRNVFTDVSASWARPLDGYLALVRAQEWDIVDKLLFGSDYPMWTPREAVEGIRELARSGGSGLPRVSDDTLDRLLNGNPLTQLGLSQ